MPNDHPELREHLEPSWVFVRSPEVAKDMEGNELFCMSDAEISVLRVLASTSVERILSMDPEDVPRRMLAMAEAGQNIVERLKVAINFELEELNNGQE